jgi:predicted RNase H-like nuclease (RuvC/YqgF family)
LEFDPNHAAIEEALAEIENKPGPEGQTYQQRRSMINNRRRRFKMKMNRPKCLENYNRFRIAKKILNVDDELKQAKTQVDELAKKLAEQQKMTQVW